MLLAMCGRFTQTRSWPELVTLYRLPETPAGDRPAPRYNIAPTQDVAVVRAAPGNDVRAAAPGNDVRAAASGNDVRATAGGGARELVMLRWGLVPFWAKDAAMGGRLINARAETVAEKPAFRAAFRKRRCLVAADGFYEWQAAPRGPKQPFHVTTDRPFAFAGLWERWTPPQGDALETCTIITTAASAAVRPVHDRMPVMLAPEAFDMWLAAELPAEAALTLLQPWDGPLTVRAVDRRVNAVRNDDAALILPAAAAGGL